MFIFVEYSREEDATIAHTNKWIVIWKTNTSPFRLSVKRYAAGPTIRLSVESAWWSTGRGGGVDINPHSRDSSLKYRTVRHRARCFYLTFSGPRDLVAFLTEMFDPRPRRPAQTLRLTAPVATHTTFVIPVTFSQIFAAQTTSQGLIGSKLMQIFACRLQANNHVAKFL